MARFRLLLAIPIFFIAIVGVLILFTDPIAPMRWYLSPQYKKEANAFLSAVSGGDYEKASNSWSRMRRQDTETNAQAKTQWSSEMQKLKEQGFYPVEYGNLKVPYDREHIDGRAHITFMEDGKRQSYDVTLNFDVNGVNQACIFPSQTKHTEAWNKINCHY
ncbi:hypothetical protein QJ48_15175 [Paenibacillus sp. A3]|uniref:hypothetical protein n=1 Tax=Paenibacillus sp. A3 TaxID=1337054 RepID=UPI0006D53010|nr:hypothetical protein [Paenibacillus sp. A3]KPV58711.1 hypothetical protein QJ48_15175 [Paenibacillus sp. A3]